MHKFKSSIIFSVTTLIALLLFNNVVAQKKNVLFIIVDDLKPELGCYGSKIVKSPNIDELAKTSTLFSSAYCQQAICGPTRASVLTGLRPDKTQVWDLKAKMRDMLPNVVTLPQYFKSNGYLTMAMGKVFDQSNTDKFGDSASWSVPLQKTFKLAKGYEDIAYGFYQNPIVKQKTKALGDSGKDETAFYGPDKEMSIRFSTECLDVPDNAYMDAAMADYAVKQLKDLKKQKQPFFMAVGFKKPHLPFIAPKKYWDLYDRSKIKLAQFVDKAAGSPDFAYHNAGELRSYAADIKPLDDKQNTLKLSEEKQKELLHGYYACISYTDAQIGKLINALKANGLDKNTIVVLIGDHGWHLGDHSQWCKHSNFEQAVKVPMIVKIPGVSKGQKNNNLVELVDLYPTLCNATNLKAEKYLDGQNLIPTIKNPNVKTKGFSISQYPRGFGGDPRGIMGYSIRTNQYRFTQWIGDKFTTAQMFDEKKVKAIELYDYINDPLETKNLANEPAMKFEVLKLSQMLNSYYQLQFETNKITTK
jgi:iduronate 2-sulfatase